MDRRSRGGTIDPREYRLSQRFVRSSIPYLPAVRTRHARSLLHRSEVHPFHGFSAEDGDPLSMASISSREAVAGICSPPMRPSLSRSLSSLPPPLQEVLRRGLKRRWTGGGHGAARLEGPATVSNQSRTRSVCLSRLLTREGDDAPRSLEPSDPSEIPHHR
jgi:hypothetical protein